MVASNILPQAVGSNPTRTIIFSYSNWVGLNLNLLPSLLLISCNMLLLNDICYIIKKVGDGLGRGPFRVNPCYMQSNIGFSYPTVHHACGGQAPQPKLPNSSMWALWWTDTLKEAMYRVVSYPTLYFLCVKSLSLMTCPYHIHPISGHHPMWVVHTTSGCSREYYCISLN